MRKLFTLIALFPVAFILSIAFQNCGTKQSPLLLESSLAPTDQNQPNSASTPAPIAGNSLEAQAITLLQNKCYSCHGGTQSAGGVSQINNPVYLISIGQIIPGNPGGSPLFTAMSSGRMPLGSTALTSAELAILNDWILAGAAAPSSGAVDAPVVIPLAGNYKSIQANILGPKCISCHSAAVAKSGVRLDTYALAKSFISGVNPRNSKLYQIVSSGEMPPRPGVQLTQAELQALSDWIVAGSPNN